MHRKLWPLLAAGWLGSLPLLECPSHAAPFSVPIIIDDENDINQLYFDGEIDEDTHDHLLALLTSRLDLNLATRDELYELPDVTYSLADAILKQREKLGRFRSVSELLAIEGMTPDIYEQVRPFVMIRSEAHMARRYDAEIRLGGIGRTRNDEPSFYLRNRTKFLTYGGAGLLLAVRPMIGGVNDAVEGWMCKSKDCYYGKALTASPEALRFDPAGFYALWDGPRLSVIGGTYRIGYGLGLTMDNSKRRLPHGWYYNVDFTENNDDGTLRPFEGFTGLSLRYKKLELGPGWFDLSAFGSFWNRDLYVNDVLYNREQQCPPGDPGCKLTKDTLPAICDEDLTYRDEILGDGHNSLYCDYPTLPGIMRDLVGGGNATYWINHRSFVGVTGYAGNWKMNAETRYKDLRPAYSSKYPYDRSTWGAAGINTRFGMGRYDFGGELAFTDRGSLGLLLKAWLDPAADLEITPSFRYYSRDFDNPYARAEADADEYLGIRARDELGGRLKVTYRPLKWLRLHADLDVWYHKYLAVSCAKGKLEETSSRIGGTEAYGDACNAFLANMEPHPSTDLKARLRARISITSKERITLLAHYFDEDLSKSGHDLHYGYYSKTVTNEDLTKTKVDLSGGSMVSWAIRLATTRIPRMNISAMFRQYFEDNYQISDDYDHSWYAWLRIGANLAPGPWLVARIKYFDEFTGSDPDRYKTTKCDTWIREDWGSYPVDLPGSCRGESYLDLYFQATQSIPLERLSGSYLRLRVGWTHWTDHRAKWAQGYVCDRNPTRDEVLVKGHLLVKF